MKVSLCMIARDEAGHLAACLSTVTGLVFEIVVVDTGSTDETRAIAGGFGARGVASPWAAAFLAARTESIPRARGAFIFGLAPDEGVPEASRAELAALFGALEPKSGYLLRSVSPGPNGTPIRDARQLRIFPNDPRL